MKEITQFDLGAPGSPSNLGALDPSGSSVDRVFAQAVMANKPTSVLEEAGIVKVKRAGESEDIVSFPIVRNTRLNWTEIGRGTNDNGSVQTTSQLNEVEYKEVTPTVKTANLFIPDNVSLLNKVDFQVYSEVGGRDASRKMEQDALSVLTTESNVGTVRTAGGFTTGDVETGSTITPQDILKMKTELGTGSNINYPDFILMHPQQYEQFNSDADFAPGASTNGAMKEKARFNGDGDIVRFNGMDIFATELIEQVGSGTGSYAADGHPVVIGKRGIAVGRGEHAGIKISTEDSRLRHGQWKIFDMSYDHAVLVQESLGILRCADE